MDLIYTHLTDIVLEGGISKIIIRMKDDMEKVDFYNKHRNHIGREIRKATTQFVRCGCSMDNDYEPLIKQRTIEQHVTNYKEYKFSMLKIIKNSITSSAKHIEIHNFMEINGCYIGIVIDDKIVRRIPCDLNSQFPDPLYYFKITNTV